MNSKVGNSLTHLSTVSVLIILMYFHVTATGVFKCIAVVICIGFEHFQGPLVKK